VNNQVFSGTALASELLIKSKSNNSQELCAGDMSQYVVFAQIPIGIPSLDRLEEIADAIDWIRVIDVDWILDWIVDEGFEDRNNIELVHEHMFFCDNGVVVDNVGYSLLNSTQMGLWEMVSRGLSGAPGSRLVTQAILFLMVTFQ
jgi:hypothetical protein